MGKKEKAYKLKILITILLTAALLVLAIPFSKYFLIASHQEIVTTKTLKVPPSDIPTSEQIASPTISDVLSASKKNNIEALGQIVIPKVGVIQPIFVGLTSRNMVEGVVNLFPERQTDISSLTLIGHHVLYFDWGDTLLFGGIKKLQPGDSVYIRYLNKDSVYQVESNVIVRDTDINRLADKGANYLILVTCNTSTVTPYRVIVSAKKISKNNGPQFFQEIFEKTQQMRTKQYVNRFLYPLIVFILVYISLICVVWRM